MLLPLLALLVTDTTPPARPLETETVQAGVSFVVQRQPAIPVVALRLAILTEDPAGYAGAGHLIQHLLLPTLREQAARVGGLVEMERSSDAIVYTLTGPAAELDYLAGVLRTALQTPRPGQVELLVATRALAEERLAEWETADQHIRSALRARLFPNDISAAGTDGSAERLTAEALPRLWTEMYRPERVSILAVGDVRLGELQTAFANVPARTTARSLPELQDTISLVPLAPAQATRGWLSVGYLANDVDPAAISIATRLLGDDLRRRIPTAEVRAEHWWTHYGQAVVVVVSAPERDLAAARRTLSTAVSTVERDVTAARVTAAARAIRHEMLFYSRTPDRMAEVIGTFADREGDAAAAQQFYGNLEEVGADPVRDALAYLGEQSAVRYEILPPPPAPSSTTPTQRPTPRAPRS
jgi:predicted Zn-dependent peptidase